MFKILYRTLIILTAAVLVAFGLHWFSGTSAGQTVFASRGGEHERPAITQATGSAPSANAQPPQNFEPGAGKGGHDGANVARALSDLPGKLGIFAAITAVIVLTRKLLSLLPRKHGHRAVVSASA